MANKSSENVSLWLSIIYTHVYTIVPSLQVLPIWFTIKFTVSLAVHEQYTYKLKKDYKI